MSNKKNKIDSHVPITCMVCLEVKHFSKFELMTGVHDVCIECYPIWKEQNKKNHKRKYRPVPHEHEEWMQGENQ